MQWLLNIYPWKAVVSCSLFFTHFVKWILRIFSCFWKTVSVSRRLLLFPWFGTCPKRVQFCTLSCLFSTIKVRSGKLMPCCAFKPDLKCSAVELNCMHHKLLLLSVYSFTSRVPIFSLYRWSCDKAWQSQGVNIYQRKTEKSRLWGTWRDILLLWTWVLLLLAYT